uniref:Uncharacterized protein n=1 Tax=viral metagenome TaxID=1070528 RepID=A0A6C0D298_9ZZZZ
MENTTNINELPMDTTPPENRNLPEGELNSSVNRMIDPNSRQNEERHVRFQEGPSHSQLKKNFELKDSHKIIILATILFLLFSDPKVKAYIMNILEVIFGKFLRTQTGTGTTKIGLAFYASVFGTALLLCVSFIDLSAFKLAF